MHATQAINIVQSRLTRYYLDRLRQANDSARRGPGNRDYWQRAIQQDWEQIKQRQAWAASSQESDPEQARLCALFSIATADILRMHLSPGEQLMWAQQSLSAARRLHDREAERTLLYHVSHASLTLEHLEQVDVYARQLLEIAQADDDKLHVAHALYILGSVDFTRGSHDSAEVYYTQSIAQYEACHAIKEMPLVWRGLGRVTQFRGNYALARDYYQRYLETSTAVDNDFGVFDAHIALSGICLALRDYPLAEQYARRAVTLGRVFEHSRLFPPAVISLAHAEKWLGHFEDASIHYVEAVAAARSIGSPSTISNGLYGLGQTKYRQGDYAAAQTHLEEAYEVARLAQHTLRVCEAAHDLVYILIAQCRVEAARDQLRAALPVARRIGTPHFLTKTLAAAITVWWAAGDYEQAAIWAGLLMKHTALLHPSLFDLTVCDALENALGSTHYQQAQAQGAALTLDEFVAQLADMLDAADSG